MAPGRSSRYRISHEPDHVGTADAAELLGTTWRNRRSGEIAVVWRLSDGIHLIDVDWEIDGSTIVDATPREGDPKYWVLESREHLTRDWEQLRAGWVRVGP